MKRIPALFIAVIICLFGTASGQAEVNGRYVYFANALSERMRVTEIEIYSGGVNVIARHPETITRGLEAGLYRIDRSPEEIAQKKKMLTDGVTDTTSPGVDFASLYSVGGEQPLRNASFEVDLGRVLPIDKINIYMGRYNEKLTGDLGWRLLVVLDASRRVVAWKSFNIYADQAKDNAGKWVFDLQPTPGGFTGRVVAPGQACWFTEVDFLQECLNKSLPGPTPQLNADQTAQINRFQHRNDPAQIEQLADRFFHMAVDLDHPSMAQVKPLVEQKRYAEAFEAFKRPMFKLLEPMGEWDGGWKTDNIYSMYGWPEDPDCLAAMQAKDMLRGFKANLKTLTIGRVDPQLSPVCPPDHPMPSRPLLVDYALNRRIESLRLWEQMIDSWSIEYQDAADNNPADLRNYFVLDSGQLGRTMRDFYQAAHANPKLVDEMSGVTLARLLLPMLEEIPVSAWRVERKCVFNHTFNSSPTALWLSMYMPEFRAIQRQRKEAIQGFTRLTTLASYRDGPMVEMGDEGHFSVQLGTPVGVYGILKHYGMTDWLTSATEKYFLDHIQRSAEFGIRHLSQTGTQWRCDASDQPGYVDNYLNIADPKWANFSYSTRMTWDQTSPNVLFKVMQEPELRAVIDTVFGRGHDSYPLRNRMFTRDKIAKVYGGKYEGKPEFQSDFLPYAGLWYFRSGWDREDAFLHMMNPPISNALSQLSYSLGNTAGGKAVLETPTSYRFVDYATPLLSSVGIYIDGLPPAPAKGRFPSGSKQTTFSQAVEKPQFSRWYSGPDFDFGEATYRGDYLRIVKGFGNQSRNAPTDIVRNATATRQIFQIRPARLFLQIDRVAYADPNESHTNQLLNCMQLTEPDPKSGRAFSEQDQLIVSQSDKQIRTSCPDDPGLSICFFGQSDISLSSAGKAPGTFGTTITLNGYRRSTARDIAVTWKARGASVLISALRANKPGESPIISTHDLSTSAIAGGEFVTEGNIKTTFLFARNAASKLSCGAIHANAEALVIVDQPGQPLHGILLGANAASFSGKTTNIPTPDCQFTLNGGQVQFTPIYKPIDPPKILPMVNTFVDRMEVSIVSDTPNIDIYYTTDGSDPTHHSTHYSGPFTITQDSFIQARAFRKGVTSIPFTINGTQVSEISYGAFSKQAPLPADTSVSAVLSPGLKYEYLEGRWFALWTYTNELPALKSGIARKLMDVSMRATDGPFAVRYKGFIRIPETGVYTFYGPDEFVNDQCEPGYDLRVYMDGREWELGQMWHGRGMWSVALEKGLHRFEVTFADARDRNPDHQRVDLWNISNGWGYPQAQTTWRGTAPVLEISGPGMNQRSLPEQWLVHPEK